MNKKSYQTPIVRVVALRAAAIICTSPGGEGTGVHDDDPQNPGGAMIREYKGSIDWDDWN